MGTRESEGIGRKSAAINGKERVGLKRGGGKVGTSEPRTGVRSWGVCEVMDYSKKTEGKSGRKREKETGKKPVRQDQKGTKKLALKEKKDSDSSRGKELTKTEQKNRFRGVGGIKGRQLAGSI